MTTKFQPGQSGNPGGRPKVIGEVRDLARAYTTVSIESLAEIAKGKTGRFDDDGREFEHPPAARVAAAVALLDRAWGKAPQTMAGEGGEGDLRLVTVVELVAATASNESGG